MTGPVTLGHSDLNTLELMLAGAIRAHYELPDGEHLRTLRVGFEPPVREPLELVDPEGTPVARVSVSGVETTSRGTWIAGDVAPLRPLDHLPFASLRVSRLPLLPAAVLLMGVAEGGLVDPGMPVIVPDLGDTTAIGRLVRFARASGAHDVRVLPVPTAGDQPDRVAVARRLALDLVAERITVEGHPAPSGGLVVLFTGLSGSGKSTIAKGVAERLAELDDRRVTLLDGDEVRTMLSAGLGFSRADREMNVRRIGWVAALAARHGGLALCAPIAPYASTRLDLRRMAEDAGAQFRLVHVSTPLEVCEARDRKGMYARARAGEIVGFTGIDDPYEEPGDADIRLDTTDLSIDDAVSAVVRLIGGESP